MEQLDIKLPLEIIKIILEQCDTETNYYSYFTCKLYLSFIKDKYNINRNMYYKNIKIITSKNGSGYFYNENDIIDNFYPNNRIINVKRFNCTSCGVYLRINRINSHDYQCREYYVIDVCHDCYMPLRFHKNNKCGIFDTLNNEDRYKFWSRTKSNHDNIKPYTKYSLYEFDRLNKYKTIIDNKDEKLDTY